MEIVSWQFGAFVVAVLAVYYLLPSNYRVIWLLLGSYAFYISHALHFALVLLLLTLANYFLARKIARVENNRGWLWAGVGLNILALAVLKYANFLLPFVPNIEESSNLLLAAVLLPVGLSFVVLQAISYLVDVSRKQMEPVSGFPLFALYLAYFPKLVAGPLERARVFVPILSNPLRLDGVALTRSFSLIVVGLVRKVVIADQLRIRFFELAFTDPFGEGFGLAARFTCLLAFAFYLYNDFAGYSSIVRGVSGLFGVTLSPNFLAPYFSRSFAEFWNRWHISLSHWLRDYVYYPVTRALLRRNPGQRTLPNLILPPLATMFVSALWHEVSLHMLVWGLLHAVFQILERVRSAWRPVIPANKQPVWRQIAAIMVVFSLSVIAWLPFHFDLRSTFLSLARMTDLANNGGLEGLDVQVYALIAQIGWLDWAQYRSNDELVFLRWPRIIQAALLALALLAIVLSALGGTVGTFIYQGF